MKFKDYQDTIVIELDKFNLNDINKKIRWSYRKAMKNGVKIQKTKPEELKEIHEIIIKHGEDNHYHSYSRERLLQSFLKEVMFTCYFEGMIIGCLILTNVSDDEMKVDTCVVEPRYKHLEAYTFLWIKAIEYAIVFQKKVLDLGGIYVDPSPHTKYYNITRFKERLGGKVIRKDLYYSNPLYVLGRKVVRYCKRKGYMK